MGFASAIAASAAADAIEVTALPKVVGRVAHIDGDYLCYYSSGNDECTPGNARANALQFVQRSLDRTGSNKAVMHLTAANCHKGERYLAATVKPYQGQRSGRKPKNWEYLRTFLESYTGDAFQSKIWASREADDGIAACARFAVKSGRLDAIVTADKDMRMLPGVHLCWKDHNILTEVPDNTWSIYGEDGKIYGDKWFWLQMLHGDTADDIPGLEYVFSGGDGTGKPLKQSKVGPKTAEQLLGGVVDNVEAYDIVSKSYWRSYRGQADQLGYDRFVEQACLLWLRQDNTAEVTSFAQKWGYLFDDKMWAAVQRLDQRVKHARAHLNAMGG